MIKINKIIAFIILQVLLISQLAWAGTEQLQQYTLSPQLNINNDLLQGSVLQLTFKPELSRNIISNGLPQQNTILTNYLITVAFNRIKPLARQEDSLAYKIKALLESQDPMLREIISEADAKGKAWIQAESLKILKELLSKPAYEKFAKVDNWPDFVSINTQGDYDMKQLLINTFGTADFLQQVLKRLEPNSPDYIQTKQEIQEKFRWGYIVLRAIDFAAQENKENQQNKQTFLPQVNLERLNQDQAFLAIDRLKNAYKNTHTHILEDAEDINPEHAYAINAVDDLKIVFMAQRQRPGYQLLEVPLPDTYYIAVIKEGTVIGYGAIGNWIIGETNDIFISFKIFNQYRHQNGKVSKQIFKSMLAGSREIFQNKNRRFIIPAHQITDSEGIDSGSVVFYLKMGFKCDNKNIQGVWEMKYRDRVMAMDGEALNQSEINEIAKNRLILDLNDMSNYDNSKSLNISVSSLKITNNIGFIVQSI